MSKRHLWLLATILVAVVASFFCFLNKKKIVRFDTCPDMIIYLDQSLYLRTQNELDISGFHAEKLPWQTLIIQGKQYPMVSLSGFKVPGSIVITHRGVKYGFSFTSCPTAIESLSPLLKLWQDNDGRFQLKAVLDFPSQTLIEEKK